MCSRKIDADLILVNEHETISISHECIEEIPKLKLDIGCGDSIQKSILKVLFNSEISYLQEFQYGKDVFQTTTNKTQNQASKDVAE